MKVEFTTDIGCSPKRLWPWLTEPERMKQWMKGLLSVEPSNPGALKVGAVAKMTIKEGMKAAVYDERIDALELHRHLRVALTAPHLRGLEMIADYRLEDLGDATRLHYVCECNTSRTLFKVLGFIFAAFVKRQAKKFMTTLKQCAESGGAASLTTS